MKFLHALASSLALTLALLFFFSLNISFAQEGSGSQSTTPKSCTPGPGVCCGIKLNTNVPFIGNCIEFGNQSDTYVTGTDASTSVNALNAFPILAGGLTRILLTIILVVGLVAIIIGGVMIASSGADSSLYDQGKKLIRGVVVGIAIIGASGVILNLINPNFFK